MRGDVREVAVGRNVRELHLMISVSNNYDTLAFI